MMLLKKLVPSSLFGRFLMIIIIPGVLLPIFTTYMFYERHWKSVNRHMTASLSGEIALLVNIIQTEPPQIIQKKLSNAKDFLSLRTNFINNFITPEADSTQPNEFIELREQLEQRLNLPISIAYTDQHQNDITIVIKLNDGRTFNVTTSRKRIENPTTYIFISGILVTAGILLILAILFSKNQIRAITRLSEAAEKFGKGLEISTTFKPEGAKEVRQAGIAFIKMKERIRRQVKQRTEMLASISHDLRTPLTRMKLQLSFLDPSDDVKELQSDVEDMTHLVNEYLAFAQGQENKEALKSTSLSAIIKEDILSNYKDNKHITTELDHSITLPLKPIAFKRSLNNLIDNGLKYGKDVHITTYLEDDSHAVITIDDNGSGIPEKEYDNVFRPFYRLESSRNSETGGTGLGMAIARDLINSHGGELTLSSSPQKGLRVTIFLPL